MEIMHVLINKFLNAGMGIWSVRNSKILSLGKEVSVPGLQLQHLMIQRHPKMKLASVSNITHARLLHRCCRRTANRSTCRKIIRRHPKICVTYLLAVAIPNIWYFFQFLGSITIVCFLFIFPAAIVLRYCYLFLFSLYICFFKKRILTIH
ncbi:hypothetical protein GLYMA_02G260200v4 [Glycine max]|uniref:Amino acid transporter transmembrane domain-containing protein n=1 Tax=Glycine max TaxID=3847 RepID=K7KAU1_SOYBN|nr:hypothetical protein JHK87_005282 [Glycine soja]KAG5064424.1 hypothetical protein JHK85_005607 [Glycine max]KAH1062130.1 hypothetical protein GYH30_005243 [Glycine max]KRH73227.1 hypothetical protein GLYMA_02G260200v4 [Glycine max]